LRPVRFVVPGPLDQLTGGYLFDRHLIEGMAREGRAVEVVSLPGRFALPDRHLIEGMAREAARAALEASRPEDIVVIDGLALPAFEGSLAEHAARLTLIAMIHHPLSLETGLPPATVAELQALEGKLLRQCRGILCPSEESARAIMRLGQDPARIAISPPGTARPARILPPSDGPPIRFLTVATLIPRKGHLLLIEALAALKRADWRLLCIGSLERDPALVRTVRQAIRDHGLATRVTLAGEWPQSALDRAYAEAHAFVLPSFFEGYGMVFAEALAWHLPIIATSTGATPELVTPEAGLLVPPGDRDALEAGLRRFLDEPEWRRSLSSGAARQASRLQSWESAVRNWIEAMDRLAG